MVFLFRILVIGAVSAGLGYAGLYALGQWVEPEQREITIPIEPPRARPGS